MGYTHGKRDRLTEPNHCIKTDGGHIRFNPDTLMVCVDPTADLEKDEVYEVMYIKRSETTKGFTPCPKGEATLVVVWNHVRHYRRYKIARFKTYCREYI